MFEKVNPSHPDKVADRIAGAIVDLAYRVEENPKVAVEVLIGHGTALVIVESSVKFLKVQIQEIVERISGIKKVNYKYVPQDVHLAENQEGKFRCGDNGIFKGVPVTAQQIRLTNFAKSLYEVCPYDGKYIETDDKKVIVCQSHYRTETLKRKLKNDNEQEEFEFIVNPLGDWSGGLDVDSGATNRKLGSDMADSVTGGGLHGKDLSKADVSVNIYAFIKAQQTQQEVKLSCAIGDETIDGLPYDRIVEIARNYIRKVGGFEKFAEWGLVR